MMVHGSDCSLVIRTSHGVIDIPFVSETVREDVIMLYEEASIEGDGTIRGMRKPCGTIGVIVTPLTIETAPLLLFLAFGFAENPVYVSGTRDMYKHYLYLISTEVTNTFDVIQGRRAMNNGILLYEDCRISAFELRIEREQSIKLKVNITGDKSPIHYLDSEAISTEHGERFYGDYVIYKINEHKYKNIYGVTIICKKYNGIKTELWIRRVLESNSYIPTIIDEMVITVRLLRDSYEERHYGMFSFSLKNLVMISDETNIESSDAVMGMLRYYVNGSVSADVFSSGESL